MSRPLWPSNSSGGYHHQQGNSSYSTGGHGPQSYPSNPSHHLSMQPSIQSAPPGRVVYARRQDVGGPNQTSATVYPSTSHIGPNQNGPPSQSYGNPSLARSSPPISSTSSTSTSSIQGISSGLRIRSSDLTPYEVEEIKSYASKGEVYFVGRDVSRKVHTQVGHIDAFLSDKNHYKLTAGDHIAYRYEIKEILGEGSFSRVVRAYDHRDNIEVAVKVIKRSHNEHVASKKELSFLRRIKDMSKTPLGGVKGGLTVGDRLERLIDYIPDFRGHLCIVVELLYANLYRFLQLNHFSIPTSVVKQITKSMLESVAALHSLQIVHRDVKPENIVLTIPTKPSTSFKVSDLNVKLVDFGSARAMNEDDAMFYMQSRYYRSPEIVLNLPYSAPIDIFSIGCIVAELITGVPLFPSINEIDHLHRIMELLGPPPQAILNQSHLRGRFLDDRGYLLPRPNFPLPSTAPPWQSRKVGPPGSRTLQQVFRVLNHRVQELPNACSRTAGDDTALCDLILRMVAWDPSKRITALDALQHPWFTGSNLSSWTQPSNSGTSAPSTTTGISVGDSISSNDSAMGPNSSQEARHGLTTHPTSSPNQISFSSSSYTAPSSSTSLPNSSNPPESSPFLTFGGRPRALRGPGAPSDSFSQQLPPQGVARRNVHINNTAPSALASFNAPQPNPVSGLPPRRPQQLNDSNTWAYTTSASAVGFVPNAAPIPVTGQSALFPSHLVSRQSNGHPTTIPHPPPGAPPSHSQSYGRRGMSAGQTPLNQSSVSSSISPPSSTAHGRPSTQSAYTSSHVNAGMNNQTDVYPHQHPQQQQHQQQQQSQLQSQQLMQTGNIRSTGHRHGGSTYPYTQSVSSASTGGGHFSNPAGSIVSTLPTYGGTHITSPADRPLRSVPHPTAANAATLPLSSAQHQSIISMPGSRVSSASSSHSSNTSAPTNQGQWVTTYNHGSSAPMRQGYNRR